MTLETNNLKFLQSFNPQLHHIAVSLPDLLYTTPPSKKGPPTLTFRVNDQEYYIHSKFDPVGEAKKLIEKSETEPTHLVVLGLGAGYHLEQLMTTKPPDTRVLLVEPNLELIKHSTKTMNWKTVFDRRDIFFCFGNNMNTLSNTVHDFIDVTTFDKLGVIELASEVRFHTSFFDTAKETINNEIKTILYDFKTRLAEDAMAPKNILKNINGILRTRRVKDLEDKFSGRPGFIVSAGPSLDKNILHLKKNRDRAVIICVDTALKPLLKKGIHPHFTLTADPSYKNYLHLQGTENALKYFLVADTAIAAQVYRDFNEHMFSASLGKPIFSMIEQNIGEVGEIEAWGSVISFALNFAIYLDLDPIVFLGQDFAFTDMRNHCRGTSWEEKWLEYTRDLDLMQRKEKQSITGVTKISEVPDIYGRPTATSDRLMLYKSYLAKIPPLVPDKTFINATEGGVFNEIEAKKLHDVMTEYVYPLEPMDLDTLFDIPLIHNPKHKKQLLAFLKSKSGFFRKYKRKLETLLPRVEKGAKLPLTMASPLLEECERLKDSLYDNVQNGEIVEMWSQGPIFHYLKNSTRLQRQTLGPANQEDFFQLFIDYFGGLIPLVADISESFDAGAAALKNPADAQDGKTLNHG